MRYLLCITIGLACLIAVPAGEPTDWQALTQKPYAKAKLPDLGLKPLLVKDGKPITAKADWPARRQELSIAWQERLGTFPKKPASLDLRDEEALVKGDGYTRKLISFLSAEGDRVLAYLLIP